MKIVRLRFMAVLVLVLGFATAGYTGDIRIEFHDPDTGETRVYEKTYTDEEQALLDQQKATRKLQEQIDTARENMKAAQERAKEAAEEAKRKAKLPSQEQIALEKKYLEEEHGRRDRLDLLEKDPAYYFYKKEQDNEFRRSRPPVVISEPPVVIPLY